MPKALKALPAGIEERIGNHTLPRDRHHGVSELQRDGHASAQCLVTVSGVCLSDRRYCGRQRVGSESS